MLARCSHIRATRWGFGGGSAAPNNLLFRSLWRLHRHSERKRKEVWRDYVPPNLPVEDDRVSRVISRWWWRRSRHHQREIKEFWRDYVPPNLPAEDDRLRCVT